MASRGFRFGPNYRRAVKGALGFSGIGLLFACQSDEGIQRAVSFNYYVLPIALHYKAIQLLARTASAQQNGDDAFARLHAHYAPKTLDIILRLKGFYVKSAQFLSQYPDVLPEEYVEAYKILRDEAPCMSFCEVQHIVEGDFGMPLNQVFSQFDTKPLGAASIGQVHAARLLDGSDVVVKVQYPGAERQFHIDINLCMRAASVLCPYYLDIFEKLQRNFATEFDYRREAALQREAHVNLGSVPGVRVPLPFDSRHPTCLKLYGRGLVTKNVFVMERLYGKSVDKWANEQIMALASKLGKSVDEVQTHLRSLSAAEVEKLIPSSRAIKVHTMFMALRDGVRNTTAFAYNWTLGWLGTPIEYKQSPRVVNVHEVADHLFKIQARCIFEHGFFNGDPHAGNVLLLDDGSLGLIDWGQVARLDQTQRLTFAKAIVAVAERDELLIAKLAWDMGVRTEKGDKWVMMKLGTFWLGSFADDVTAELGGATSFDANIARIDKLVVTAEDYFLAVRCLMMTRGVVALMGFPGADSSVRLKPWAEAVLRKAGVSFEATPHRKLPRPNVERLLGFPERRDAM